MSLKLCVVSSDGYWTYSRASLTDSNDVFPLITQAVSEIGTAR